MHQHQHCNIHILFNSMDPPKRKMDFYMRYDASKVLLPMEKERRGGGDDSGESGGGRGKGGKGEEEEKTAKTREEEEEDGGMPGVAVGLNVAMKKEVAAVHPAMLGNGIKEVIFYYVL